MPELEISEKLLEIYQKLNKSTAAHESIPYDVAKFKHALIYMPEELIDQVYAALVLEKGFKY